MKVLIDVSAGESIAECLRNLGHDVVSVRERDAKMTDVDILNWANSEERIVVTLDKDFGELVYRNGLPHCGILLLRLDGARKAVKVAVVTDVFTKYDWAIPNHFCVYQDGRLRVR